MIDEGHLQYVQPRTHIYREQHKTMDRQLASNLALEPLENYSCRDLEEIKKHIATLKFQILNVQNARCHLLRLPGELRDIIFGYAMLAEIHDRRARGKYNQIFGEPAFLRACKQLRADFVDVWYTRMLVWEEWNPVKRCWRELQRTDVREIVLTRSSSGLRSLTTQPVYCTLERTRDAVMASRSICPRMGLVRASRDSTLPQVRWWIQ
jgi:hypothetical protein